MAITVIHGQQATGKTSNAEAFRLHYGCGRIVDDWRPRSPFSSDLSPRDGDLVLTTESVIKIAKHLPDARLVDVNTARASIGLCAAPAGGFPVIASSTRGLWYYANELDAEYWFGGCRTREEAVDRGRAWAEGKTFWIGLGTPSDNRLDIFGKDLPSVTLAFDEVNEENYGEDGEGGPHHWNEAHCADLSRRLNAVFGEWAKQHGYERGWMLDFTAQQEIRPVLTLARVGAC